MGIRRQNREARLEARIRLRGIAAIICPNMPIKAQIECLAEQLGWTRGRVQVLWYGRAEVLSSEMDALRRFMPLD